jgi:hypothetical protein
MKGRRQMKTTKLLTVAMVLVVALGGKTVAQAPAAKKDDKVTYKGGGFKIVVTQKDGDREVTKTIQRDATEIEGPAKDVLPHVKEERNKAATDFGTAVKEAQKVTLPPAAAKTTCCGKGKAGCKCVDHSRCGDDCACRTVRVKCCAAPTTLPCPRPTVAVTRWYYCQTYRYHVYSWNGRYYYWYRTGWTLVPYTVVVD